MLVKNKKNGKIYSFPAHLLATHPEYEEYTVSVESSDSELSYKELKAKAREAEVEFKGNISKEDLIELLSK